MATNYNATVTDRSEPAPGTICLRVRLDQGSISFEPGQYTVLGLHRSSPRIADSPLDAPDLSAEPGDPMIRRPYSITSNSRDDELEFVVSLVRSGSLTPRLFNLQVGGRLFVEPKAHGAFTMERSSGNRDLLLVATGSALAPYISMLRTEFPENHETLSVVVHAAAAAGDLVFRNQMEDLADGSRNFTYVPLVSELDAEGWSGQVGTPTSLLSGSELEDLLGLPLSPDRFDVFLSGSPEMIDSVTEELVKRGFSTGAADDPETNIFMERYW